MTDQVPPEAWAGAEWHSAASRINEIVAQYDPHIYMNMFGEQPGLGPRVQLTYGMHVEQVMSTHICLVITLIPLSRAK